MQGGGECDNSGEDGARDGDSREYGARPASQDFRLRPRPISMAIFLRKATYSGATIG